MANQLEYAQKKKRVTLSKIPHIFFHIFLYRDEYGYISIQREKLEAKLGYTQMTPIIIVDP